MEKKATIYDVAKIAGVSSATVSYVINNTEGHSISEDTKNKVWHAINLLNYKPNVFAKNLRSSGSKLVAVCSEYDSYLERAELVVVLEHLSASLQENFELVFCTAPFGRIPNADAIIAYNMARDTFHAIGNQNYIPLIAVNCLVNDKLFFQVTADYSRIKQIADNHFNDKYAFVCLEPADTALKAEISSSFENVIFIKSGEDLQDITYTNILTTSGLICEILSHRHHNVLHHDIYSPICDQTADCLNKALSRERFDIHSYKV